MHYEKPTIVSLTVAELENAKITAMLDVEAVAAAARPGCQCQCQCQCQGQASG